MGTSDEKSAPRYSDDRKWWWTGTEWVPANRAPKPQFSPDGRWWWDGTRWTAVAQPRAGNTGVRVSRSVAPIVVIVGALMVLVVGGLSISLVASLTAAHPTSPPGNSSISGTSGPSATSAARPHTTYFEVWRDPTDGAFAVLLPKGWHASGGVRRPYFNADIYLTAQDPSGAMSVYFQVAGYPRFAEPSPPNSLTCQLAPTSALCIEGSTVPLSQSNPTATLVVWRYLVAQQFIATKVLPEVRKAHPDARLVSSNARPDLASETLDTLLASRTSGADALFAYTKNGVQYEEGMVVTTHELATPSGSVWSFDVAGAIAPTSDFAVGKNVVAAFRAIVPTVTINLAWLVRELQNQNTSTALIQQASEYLKQQDYREFTSISESNAAVGQAWANALGGVEVWQNPQTREVFNVLMEPGADYVWECGVSEIARTAVEQNPDFAQCVEMRRVHP